jgi:translation initiation factor 4E
MSTTTTTTTATAAAAAAAADDDDDDSSVPSSALPLIPLHSSWTLWLDHPKIAPAGADWKENLKSLATGIDSVSKFWSVFNNVQPASALPVGANYSLFRDGMEPAWEDEHNVNGGKFVLSLPKNKNKADNNNNNNNNNNIIINNSILDEYWLYTVLALIGETMDETGDQINGAVVSIRKSQDRIALWTQGTDKNVCVAVGERWKKVLRLEKGGALSYQTHKAAAQSGRSFHNEPLFEI